MEVSRLRALLRAARSRLFGVPGDDPVEKPKPYVTERAAFPLATAGDRVAKQPMAPVSKPVSRLTDDEVKNRLRRAVTDGDIYGWYSHIPLRGKKWVINPNNGPCVSYSHDEVCDFCEMLDEAAG